MHGSHINSRMSPMSTGIQLKPVDRAGAGAERVGLHAELLQHADEQLGQRRVVLDVAGDVLAVLVAAAGEQDRQVGRAVAAGVAEVAADQHLRGIEQACRRLPCVSRSDTRKSRKAVIFSRSTIRSCSILAGLRPWCVRP